MKFWCTSARRFKISADTNVTKELSKKCKAYFTNEYKSDIISVKLTLHLKYYNHGKEIEVKNKLEELRRYAGITQEEFAKKMKVSRQTISALEKGRYNPSIILAFKIAKYFEMAIEDVFVYEEEEDEK